MNLSSLLEELAWTWDDTNSTCMLSYTALLDVDAVLKYMQVSAVASGVSIAALVVNVHVARLHRYDPHRIDAYRIYEPSMARDGSL